MGVIISKLLSSLFGEREARILVLGLDNAGKTTILYRLQVGEVVSTIPTIGFNVETVQYKNIKFQVWDLGGQTSIRIFLLRSPSFLFPFPFPLTHPPLHFPRCPLPFPPASCLFSRTIVVVLLLPQHSTRHLPLLPPPLPAVLLPSLPLVCAQQNVLVAFLLIPSRSSSLSFFSYCSPTVPTLVCVLNRPYWRCYYPNTQAVIYVVDSTDVDRMGTSKEEFHAILDEEELKEAVVLVYANKQDLPGAMSEVQVSDALGLHKIKSRPWAIYKTSAVKGDGLFEGLDWLSETLKSKGR
ncbi:unnamed protein product [Closterium sp. NIES-54]